MGSVDPEGKEHPLHLATGASVSAREHVGSEIGV